MEPIRILQIGMHDKIGGVETFLMNYYRNIDRKKVQFDFINMFDKLCFEDEIKKLGGNVYKVSNVKKRPIKYYNDIRKIIRENDYKIVHINMLSMANIVPILAAHKEGVKHIILHSHNTGTPSVLIKKILDRLNKNVAIKNATDFFACSKLAGEWLYGDRTNFEVISNAIEPEKFKYDEKTRKLIRKKLGVEENFVIGHVGRFSEQKNHEFLINMFSKFAKTCPNSRLLLIGEGELKNKIENLVKKLEISNQVILLEPKSNIQDYYQAMDVFVLPSKFEGLGIVLVEAQANGLQCICSNVVPDEVKIINTLEKVPLKIDSWIKAFNDRKDRVPEDIVLDEFKENKYDISVEAKKLTDKYIKFVED